MAAPHRGGVLATLVTAVTSGIGGEVVRVEVDVAPGLPVCHIVGLPDAAVSEAQIGRAHV